MSSTEARLVLDYSHICAMGKSHVAVPTRELFHVPLFLRLEHSLLCDSQSYWVRDSFFLSVSVLQVHSLEMVHLAVLFDFSLDVASFALMEQGN